MHTAAAPLRFDAMLKVRVHSSVPAAVAQVARRRHQNVSEYIRQVLLTHLLEEGVSLADDPETGGRRRD